MKFGQAISPNYQISTTLDEESLADYSCMITSHAIKERDDLDINYNDEYVSMTLGVPGEPDNELSYATVKKQVIDKDGVPIGKANTSIHLDSRMYEVGFLYGSFYFIQHYY